MLLPADFSGLVLEFRLNIIMSLKNAKVMYRKII